VDRCGRLVEQGYKCVLFIRMPSGVRYWTVVDDAVRVVEAPDRFLRETRLVRGRAETTTKAYAEGLSLFLRWCDRTGRDWPTAARDMGLFMIWLCWAPGSGSQRRTVVPGPGARPVRGDGRINKVLTAVRMFLVHAVVNKEAPAWVLDLVYELGDDRDLPVEARGESGGCVTGCAPGIGSRSRRAKWTGPATRRSSRCSSPAVRHGIG
jgi:integrase/recombinase XerD